MKTLFSFFALLGSINFTICTADAAPGAAKMMSGVGFNAPSYFDGSNASGAISGISEVGDIIFDSKASQFFGRVPQDSPNQWVPLTLPIGLNPVVSGSSGNRIEFATLDSTAGCAISNTSSSWLNLGSSPGSGTCIMNVSVFSSAMSCLCTSNAGGGNGCLVGLSGTTGFSAQSLSTSTGGGAPGIVTVMCIGH